MTINKETVFTKDSTGKKITVVREFDAPVARVWEAWTTPDLLDQWWAPRPWKANTVNMDFRAGGSWLYYMEGPDGTRHYCRADYDSITANKYFEVQDSFCDENGQPNNMAPSMHWKNSFTPSGEGTKVTIEIDFASPEDLEKIIEMGFREGFAAAHGNLDELLSGH